MQSAGERVDEKGQALARFLREEAARIARVAARAVTADLPIAGTGTSKRLRVLYQAQIEELARCLEAYGADGPQLYAETQRRYATRRLSEGARLTEVMEERAILHDSILEVGAAREFDFDPEAVRLLTNAFAEIAGQIGDVYLTYQRAESAGFREEALLETIVSHLDEAILVVERDGMISYATPAIERVLGYPARLFVGGYLDRREGLLDRIDPRDRFGKPIGPSDLPHCQALSTRRPAHADVILARRADGTDAVVEAYAAPVSDEEGDLRGVVMTLRDRTDSYRKSKALEDSYRERRRMHARLLSRSRLEAVGGLARSTAHALNNQLNVIALRLRRLEEVPDAFEEAEAIDRSVKEIAALVGRLQELGSAAPQAGAAAPMDAEGVVEEALALTRPEFDGRQVEVHATIGELGQVLGERETVLTLLTTILGGARDSTPAGGFVDLEAARSDGHVEVRVIEHGPRLDSDELERIFEPLAGEFEERTLSLSAGRDAVRAWGGDVTAGPLDSAGNVFTIRLPVAAAARAEAAPPQAPAPAPTPTPTARPAGLVLVVDDDPDNAAMLADLVEGADGSAITAATGAAALEKASREKPDAALVDLLLPDMKGWDVVRELKERLPGIRIAVVSGLAVRREEREAGLADDVFRKPIDSDDVLHFLGL